MPKLKHDEELLLFKTLRKFLNIYRILYFLDPPSADAFKSRNEYYHNLKHNPSESSTSSCCSIAFAKIYIPDSELTIIERRMKEIVSKSGLKVLIPKFLEKISTSFFKIKNSGLKEGLKWDDETEKHVLSDVLKEGLQREIITEMRKLMQSEQKSDSKQPGLYATPSAFIAKYPKFKFETLRNETIAELMKNNFAIQRNFMGIDFLRGLYKELNYLELEAKFEETIQEANFRNDRTLWISLNDVKEKDFPRIYGLLMILSSLPFELNFKNTGFMALSSESCQISYFNDRGAYHKMHMDSSLESKFDTGKSLTFLYFVNLDNDNKTERGKVKISKIIEGKKEEKEMEIEAEEDSILILKSRLNAYEICENFKSKRFVIRFWINGPADFVKNQF